MAQDKNETKDFVGGREQKSATDRAITAVRDFQGGKATTSFVKACLADLDQKQLLVVSIGTRVAVASLEALRA